jgi:hypothetical protein
MSIVTRFGWGAPILATLAVGALAVSYVLIGPSGGTAQQYLDGVPADVLATRGIVLSEAPAGYEPRVTADDAREAALYPNAPLREVKLANLKTVATDDMSINIRVDQVVWVLNYEPSGIRVPGGPVGTSVNKTEYSLAFVDADTGEFLFGFASGTR